MPNYSYPFPSRPPTQKNQQHEASEIRSPKMPVIEDSLLQFLLNFKQLASSMLPKGEWKHSSIEQMSA